MRPLLQARQVIDLVIDRAARLLAIALVAILAKMEPERRGGHYCIAVDGSVYRRYTRYRELIHSYTTYYVQNHLQERASVRALWDDKQSEKQSDDEVFDSVWERVPFSVEFVECVGGSCLGAAVIAAAAGAEAAVGAGSS